MKFPVDVLEATSHETLQCLADSYLNELLYSDPDHAHYFTLPSGEKVQLSLSNVGPIPLYGVDSQHNVLALFTPKDQLTVVALYLNSQWYAVEDILKTANSTREGLVKVRSVGERIVLYILNSIVYRSKEMGSGEIPFLCHSENDYTKILWKNGQAVGFYSVKPKGSVCNNSLRQCYFLPVMDSIFVRKAHRGKGYGLQMLEDFVDSFEEEELGLKYPLSPPMANMCRHYLTLHPEDADLFWEVEGVGGPYQRTKIACILKSRLLNGDTHEGGHDEDKGQNGCTAENEEEEAKAIILNLTEEILVNKHHTVTEEIDTEICTFTRSNEHRRRTRLRDEEEAKEVDSRPNKINRVETAEEKKKEFVPADGPEMLVLEKLTVDTSEEPAAEQQEAAPVAEGNQEMEVDPTANVQQKENNSAAAKEDSLVAEATPEVVPTAEKQEVASAAENSEEEVDVVKPPEVETVLKEDEMDEREDEKKTVPAISRHTSKRLRKKALEKEEKGSRRTLRGKSGRRKQRNERKGRKSGRRRGGRSRAQRRREGAREDPLVIHKMVLRRKTKLIQTTRRTRSKQQDMK